MATALRLSFRFFFDANLWCQVSRTLLQYFQRYRLFSIFHFFVANRMTSSLHNRNISISLKRKKIFQKEKRHSSLFWKAFQISAKHFSFHRHFNILRSWQRCLEAFSSPPRISYRRYKNLRDILVGAKHRRQASPASEAFRCHRRRCKTCPFITEGTISYTFFSTNEQRRIRRHITCSSSNLVYMIQCNKCNVHCIGETKRHFSDRFGEHRRAIT